MPLWICQRIRVPLWKYGKSENKREWMLKKAYLRTSYIGFANNRENLPKSTYVIGQGRLEKQDSKTKNNNY